MSRETIKTHKIALLATGDEICNGDILNTNAQEIARKLFDNGIHVGMHMAVADQTSEIEQAINFLLQSHDGLIITGGLGPTSDDLTRFALGLSIKKPLVFNEECWQTIVNRLKHFGYSTPPESNRQQALFPEGATIIPNANGTAAGCLIRHNAKIIFMLPGPPTECLPMLDNIVLPELTSAGFQQIRFHKKWFLFGVSEGQIAEELDQLAKPYDCVTGYRLFYPYIEFKLHSNNQHDFNTLEPLIKKTVAPYLIGNGQHTASELLREKIATLDFKLHFCDHATGGTLESILKTPKTHAHLKFSTSKNLHHNILIEGLKEFWHETHVVQTRLTIHFNLNEKSNIIDIEIPFRGSRVKSYATEFVCWKVLEFLRE